MEVGEPFWFRLGRETTVRSPVRSVPILPQGGKAAQQPFPAGQAEALPMRLRATQESKGGGGTSRAATLRAGSWVPWAQPGVEGAEGLCTWYVSQRRMVQRRGSSRISRLFIQRKANCRYSTSYLLKWLCTCSETGSAIGPKDKPRGLDSERVPGAKRAVSISVYTPPYPPGEAQHREAKPASEWPWGLIPASHSNGMVNSVPHTEQVNIPSDVLGSFLPSWGLSSHKAGDVMFTWLPDLITHQRRSQNGKEPWGSPWPSSHRRGLSHQHPWQMVASRDLNMAGENRSPTARKGNLSHWYIKWSTRKCFAVFNTNYVPPNSHS